jgi:hypothetical protein
MKKHIVSILFVVNSNDNDEALNKVLDIIDFDKGKIFDLEIEVSDIDEFME